MDCDSEITRYFRHMLWVSRFVKIQKPAWESHVTVIRNIEPPNKNKWELYAGEEVEFTYDIELKTAYEYFYLDVFCSRLLDIREELGFTREPECPLHLTVGNSKFNH
jgi:hypothetical protein